MIRRALLSPVLATLLTLVAPSSGSAQTQTAVPVAPDPPAFSVRVFGEAGIDQLSAAKSFNAVFGKDSGPIFGGGAEVVVRQGWFVRFSVWRFKEDGQRAVRLENQTFRLDIPLNVTITPIEVNAGYRFPVGRRRVIVPYVGGGVSSHGYKETSSFSVGDENVDERFTGYQVLGGVEYRLHRSFGVAGEVQFTSVPDALGAGGLSADFDENNLGGLVARVRVLFGR
jgi:opacity protein-like surface antigen